MAYIQTSNRPGMRSRLISERAAFRTAGAPLIGGNSVLLLRDAGENYPAWEKAILEAKEKIYFESYIIHEDEQGWRFAELLARKAHEGVRVRVIYDWMGGFWAASSKFWNSMLNEGIEVRCFNPPRLDSPLGWLGRDHRKMIAVDGRIGYVTGLCVGRMWVGDAKKGIDPWRDTGIEVRGPAVAEIENSFAQMWSLAGDPLPPEELTSIESIPQSGDTAVRVIASMPNTAGLYRLDQMIAADARETLWLTDAYYAGTTPYVQALRAAAMDGVDVRLLVPAATDLPLVRAISRSGYRPLLEAGVQVYEWNGSMLHAKTAVSDGKWARVGSTNLNLVSWISNWELDVVIEDHDFGLEMERMYLEDLKNATEITLTAKRKPRPAVKRPRRLREKIEFGSGSNAAAGAARIVNVVGASITNHRPLGPAEARITLMGGALLLIVSVLSIFKPRVITIPLAIFATWIAISLFAKAFDLYRQGRRNDREDHNEEKFEKSINNSKDYASGKKVSGSDL